MKVNDTSHHRFLGGRRDLLRGLGVGTLLLAPFARSRLAFANPADTANILIWFTPNGMYRDRFGATGSRTSFTLKSSLTPLAAYKDDLVIIKGLCNKGQSARSTHSDAMKTLICRYGDGERYKGNGPSFDHVMAQSVGQKSIFTHASPDVKGAGYMNGLSWSAAGAQRSFVSDPQDLYNDIFAGVSGTSSGTAGASKLAAEVAQNQSLLDFLKEDIATFKTRLSRPDRSKLDLHLQSVRELEKQLTATPTLPVGGKCDPLAAKAHLNADKTSNADTLKKNGLSKVELIANAFACGVRRVALLVWQNASSGLNPTGGGGNHHDITHSGSADQRASIDTWYATRFAETLEILRKHGQLDNTMVLWCSEISQEHNLNNCVNVLAGGRNLGIQTGQFIDLPFAGDEDGDASTAHQSGNASFADLLVSMQKAFGVKSDHFGDEKFSQGGLQGLYVG